MSKKHKKAQPVSKVTKESSKNIVQNSMHSAGLSGFAPFSFEGSFSSTISKVLCGANLNEYITNQPQVITRLWKKHWIPRATIEIPVQDAFKEAPKVKTDLASEEEVEQVMKAFKSKIYPKMLQFFHTVRAFGTAFLIIMPKGFKNGNVATIDLTSPLTEEEIINCKNLDFIIASPYEMYDVNATRNYLPLNDSTHLNEECPYYFQGKRIHTERVIKMVTEEPPFPVKQVLHAGGGLSVLEVIIKELEQYLTMKELALTLTNEAKVDIIAKAGYEDNVIEGRGGELRRQVESLMQGKNFYSTLIVDKNTTEYSQKQLSLANLDVLMSEFAMSCFLPTGIPPKRFGVLSSNGLSDTDKTVEQNYNKTLTFVRNWGREVILMLYKVCFIRELEYIPLDLDVEFESLDVLSELEKQTLRNQNLDNLLKLSDKIEISPDDLVKYINELKIFDKDINFKVQSKKEAEL